MKSWTSGTTRRPLGAALDGLALALATVAGSYASLQLAAAEPVPADIARLALIGAGLGCSFTASGALHLKTFRRAPTLAATARRIAAGAALAAVALFLVLLLCPWVTAGRAATDALLPAVAGALGLGLLRLAAIGLRGAPGRLVLIADPGPVWDAVRLGEIREMLAPDWRLALLRPGREGTPAAPGGIESWDAGRITDWLDQPLPRRAAGRCLLLLDRGLGSDPASAELIRRALESRMVVADLTEFYEEVTEKAALFELGPDGWYAAPVLPRPPHGQLALKRLMDLAIGLPLAVATLPVVALFAVLIRLESPGSPIFTQRRVGLGGRVFTLYKLRTMTVHEDDSAQWPAFAANKVTRIGDMLRRTGLDELPQLWNVIRGDMSLVGPRPARPQVTERHISRNPFYAVVCSVKPGISGWSQLHQGQDAGDHTMFQKARYNLYYARHYSIWFDLLICIRTFWQLVTGRKQASVYLAEMAGAPVPAGPARIAKEPAA